jgi:hypothetical protein
MVKNDKDAVSEAFEESCDFVMRRPDVAILDQVRASCRRLLKPI